MSGATHREIARRAEESGARESDLIRLALLLGLEQLTEHEPARIALMAQRTRLTSELADLYEMPIVGSGIGNTVEEANAQVHRNHIRAEQEWSRDFSAIQASFTKLAAGMKQLEAKREELPETLKPKVV